MQQDKALGTKPSYAYTFGFFASAIDMTELYFYDLETWGADPKRDRIAQFAGQRTNLALTPIAPPTTLYCQLSSDYLPDPESVLITGIVPQVCQQKGIVEADFTRRIHREWTATPDTCIVGYNNIRFDDEMMRYAFYRNFIEPYGREWQQGNSRWDLLDVVRACYALRPSGIEWPMKDDGTPSFKLEELTKANGLGHEKAHDALSDVQATIALAALIKAQQPRLFDYLFAHRAKQALLALIDVAGLTPLVHVSGMFPASQGCISWVVPLAFHPTQKNAVICYDLQQDPTFFAEHSSDTLQRWLYSPRVDLAENERRPPLKLVHLNKSPVLAPAKTLYAERAAELGIDRAACLANLEILRSQPELRAKFVELFAQGRDFDTPTYAETNLYGGFINSHDQAVLAQLSDVNHLSDLTPLFRDDRLNQMWPRFKARNFVANLSFSEQQQWRQFCQDHLQFGMHAPARTAEEFVLKVENLLETATDQQKLLLQRLCQFINQF